MAKKKNTIPPVDVTKLEDIAEQKAQTIDEPRKPLSINDFKVQAIIVAILAFIFYINTWQNEYAHDDGIVIVKNEYVQEGFAGIPKILSKDAYDSYYRQLNTSNQLSGGRYRPLSIVTFAIEQQFFGATPVDKVDSVLKQSMSYGIHGSAEKKLLDNMHVRHVFNVLWYMLGVVILLYFLRAIVFRDAPLMALVATIIFTIHPIHTEVVANVKSRDEIMSLIFMCLTFIFAFKYEAAQNSSKLRGGNTAGGNKPSPLVYLLGALVSFFLAFLSKEYAITMLVLLPLSFYLFSDYSLARRAKIIVPFGVIFVLYLLLRLQVAASGAGVPTDDGTKKTIIDVISAMGKSSENSEKEVLNNPYLYATHAQKIATEISSSLIYLKLLLFPQPLSADYSYNSIPYKNPGDLSVILSILIHMAIMAGTVVGAALKKYKPLVFAGAFYMLHLLLVNNLVFNIGATLGERLIYHSSVGFAIVVAWLLCKAAEKIQPAAMGRGVLAAVLLIVTVLCGFKTITRNADWKNDMTLFTQDIKTVPNSVLVNGNVAASYISMSDAVKDDSVRLKYLHLGVSYLDKAIAIHPGFVAGFLNQGIAYYKLGQLDSAQNCLDSVRKYYPNYPTLANLYTLLSTYHMRNGWDKYGKFGKYPEAIAEFKQGIAIDSTNSELWYNLGGALFSNKQYKEAIEAWQVSLKLKPDQPQAEQGMKAAYDQMKAAQAQPQKK